jgi:hypothetical protein
MERDWIRVIGGSTRGLTDEQIAAAAALCLRPELFPNGYPSAWHAASIVTRTLATCHCMPCETARKGR